METQQHNFGGAHTQRVLPYPMINDEGIPSLKSIPSLSEEGGRYLLRPTPGNILYKSVPRGNPQIEDNPEYPQYYNNNFPIQSVIRYENRLTKGTYLAHDSFAEYKRRLSEGTKSYPVLTATINTPAPKPVIHKDPSISRKPGYNLKMIENHGEIGGTSSFYQSVINTAEGPFVNDGLQNHNARIIKEKRIDENTDYLDRTKIGQEDVPKQLKEFDEPEERRIYELPPHKWPKPLKSVLVTKKCHDETYRPVTPLEEMTPYPDVDAFKSKVVNYVKAPYENTAQTSYLTGARKYYALNNSRYDNPPGYYNPEQYEPKVTNRPKNKRDVFYTHSRKYLPYTDSMNPTTMATPYSRRSNLPDTRRSIPTSSRKSFG